MNKIIPYSLLIFILGFSPSSSLIFARTEPSATATQAIVEQLQEQIKSLLAQIESLESQLEAVKTELKFTKLLKRGTTGDEVKQLQEFLKKLPDIYPEGLVTGYFGPLTETAVKKFQERQGLESVGAVGPKTLEKLNELVTEGAGASGAVPPGLLTAPGIEKKAGSCHRTRLNSHSPLGCYSSTNNSNRCYCPINNPCSNSNFYGRYDHPIITGINYR